MPLLDLACGAGIHELVLVAGGISDKALAILRLPANRQRLLVAAVKAPSGDVERADSLTDMALLMGGRPHLAAAGETLATARLAHLGHVRRAWADTENFGIEAGQGDPRQLRRHIAWLRGAMARAADAGDRQRLRQRLGRLIYGSAVLWVGANTPLALEARSALAKRTAEAVRGALREGVVPGGGVSLAGLKPSLLAMARRAQDEDERVACKILQRAVEAPLRALLANSGFEPESVMAEMARQPVGYGCDVTRGEIKDLAQAGIVDAAPVVKAALQNAIHSAALALTIDVLIQRSNPPLAIHRQ